MALCDSHFNKEIKIDGYFKVRADILGEVEWNTNLYYLYNAGGIEHVFLGFEPLTNPIDGEVHDIFKVAGDGDHVIIQGIFQADTDSMDVNNIKNLDRKSFISQQCI